MFELHELPLRSIKLGISDFHDQVSIFLNFQLPELGIPLEAYGRLFYGYPIDISCIEFQRTDMLIYIILRI